MSQHLLSSDNENKTVWTISDNMTSVMDGFHASPDGQDLDVPNKARSNSLYRTAMTFNMYYPPVLIATGLLGNSLSLLVLMQKNNRKFSCCVYLAGLAVADNLFMFNALHLWLMTVFFPSKFTDRHCTILAFFFQVCAVNSTLLILAVTLERYLAICFPFKSVAWRTVKRGKITIPMIFVFSMCYNLPYLKTSGLSENLLCAAIAKHDTGTKIWAWWGFVINFIIPFCLLATMNTFIVRAIHCRKKNLEPNHVKMKRTFTNSSTRENGVHKSNNGGKRSNHGSPNIYDISREIEKKRRSKMTKKCSETLSNGLEKDATLTAKMINGGANHGNPMEEHTTMFSVMLADGSPEDQGELNHTGTLDSHMSLGSRNSTDTDGRHQRQLTVMLLVVTTAFLVLTSPQYIRYIIFSFLNITEDEHTFAFATLFYHLTNKLFYTNSAVNFYLYCIAGSKFRSDVKLLWKRHFKKNEHHGTVTHKSSSTE